MAAPPSPTRDLLPPLMEGKDLTEAQAEGLARAFLAHEVPAELTSALLVALASKGETTEELFAFAKVMRENSRAFPGPREAGAIDLCGTGGARRPSFNISTVAAFLVSAAGLPVAKHGNVSARGPCGSSDLLEALGLPVGRSLRFAEQCWKEQRLVFLHAPLFHPATRAVAPVRRALGVRTIFNQLGPLTNPAQVRFQVVGAYAREYARRAGPALRRLGVDRSMFFHAVSGYDEFSSQGRSIGWAFGRDSPPEGLSIVFEPTPLLSSVERKGSLAPRLPAESAVLATEVLSGAGDGAVRGAVLLTAGAALWTAGKVDMLSEGVARAREPLENGEALSKLKALQEIAKREAWET